MDTALKIALVWHMHQPSYRDPASGRLMLPWVRLHASYSYFDMAWLLDRHPAVHGTFNFVPVLLDQLAAYLDGERDLYWELSRRPARLLSNHDRAFLLKQFFSCNWDTAVRPRSRYWRLLQKRGIEPPFRPASELSDAELRDLQVLFNLAWFGFAAHREYPLLTELDRKGRDFTEDEKRRLLDLQIAVIRRLAPLYRKLLERGQIELTTTPYYHPILPLIVDSDAAARAMPQARLPPRFQWPEDADLQVARAVEAHGRYFGSQPTGMWPAEGSVSPEIVPIVARHGIEWIATDEDQLWGSLPAGSSARRELYRPYRVAVNGAELGIIFRDRALSDLVGFTYARNPPEVAVNDLLGRLAAIRDDALGNGEPPLLAIILDGENPWPAYADGGMGFLERLYEALAEHPTLKTTLVGRHLGENPPQRTLHDLHSGSWINGNYGIWIGGPVENSAWAALGEARRFFEQARGEAAPEAVAAAHEHVLAAEGSDWFWWYGETFRSDNDADFDHLFRAHLRAVYTALGATPPRVLSRSLYGEQPVSTLQAPTAFVSPRFDGTSTYFDWAGAGIHELNTPMPSMHRSMTWFGRLRYGFDPEHVYLRLDPANPADLSGLSGLTVRARFHCTDEHYAVVPLDAPRDATLYRVGQDLTLGDPRPLESVGFSYGILELGVPLAALGVAAGDRLSIAVHLLRDAVEVDRYPSSRNVDLIVPDADFEAENWTA